MDPHRTPRDRLATPHAAPLSILQPARPLQPAWSTWVRRHPSSVDLLPRRSGHFEQLWIYGVGPALGAGLAGALTFALRGPVGDGEEKAAEGE